MADFISRSERVTITERRHQFTRLEEDGSRSGGGYSFDVDEQGKPEAVAQRAEFAAAHAAIVQARAEEIARNTEAFGEIAQIIAGNGGSFASDLAEQVRTNGLGSLTQRQFNFASDLYAKQFGRRNSKAYAAAYEAIIVRYEEVAV